MKSYFLKLRKVQEAPRLINTQTQSVSFRVCSKSRTLISGIEKGFIIGFNLLRTMELRKETQSLLLLDPGLGLKSAERDAGKTGIK